MTYSILAPNVFNSLEQINEITDSKKIDKLQSSSHFLHPFIREWIHSIVSYYNDTTAKGTSCVYKWIIAADNKILSNHENEIVYSVLGEHASTMSPYQSREVFAEAWTKFICESLDTDCINFKKDPLDEMKKTPKNFKQYLKRFQQ